MLVKRVAIFLLLAVVIMVAGCSKSQQSANAPALDREPYIIGAIFSTTGDNAPLGVPERETVEMLVKQTNENGGIDGHPVKVEFYDDEGKPEQAVQACQQLLANDKVIAVIGPTLTGPSLAIADACDKAGVPLISCAASIKIVDPVKPYVFKTAQTDSLAVEKLLDYIKANNIKTVGFINDSNAFGASGREQWIALSAKAGVKTVAMESFKTDDTKMTSQLTKIKAKNPDAVLCWGTNPGPAIVAKDMKTLGMTQPLLMSHGIANMEFIKLAGSAAEGVILPAGKLLVAASMPESDPQKQVLMKYADDYMRATGKPANSFGGYSRDAFLLVVEAAKAAGPDRKAIRDRIEDARNFAGISGVFAMTPQDHNGLTKDAFALVQIKGGKWVLIQ